MSGFSALVQNMLADADASLGAAMALAPAGQNPWLVGRQFLRERGGECRARIEAYFADYLERAMQTMYNDLRMGMVNSAANWALIDDETVEQQIEVDRLLLRVRGDQQQDLGLINMMIAQVHGHHDVRERENPFRPYLLARSLHVVVRSMLDNEAVIKVLFEHMADGMTKYVPAYYAAIRAVFESNGIDSRLFAQVSAETRGQRDAQARAQTGVDAAVHANFSDHFQSRVLASLQHMQQLQPAAQPGLTLGEAGAAPNTVQPNSQLPAQQGLAQRPQAAPQQGQSHMQLQQQLQQQQLQQQHLQQQQQLQQYQLQQQQQQSAQPWQATQPLSPHQAQPAFQDFVRQIFNQPKPVAVPRKAVAAPFPEEGEWPTLGFANTRAATLDAQLRMRQHAAAESTPAGEGEEANQILALREVLVGADASELERVTVDVVALLFEFILQDELIAQPWRAHVVRLQIPFLRAALIAPDLLHDAGHPARRLLDRLGAIAAGMCASGALDESIGAQLDQITGDLLDQFDEDMAVFSDALAALELFMTAKLANADAATTCCAQALDEAEHACLTVSNANLALHELLAPLSVDPVVADFITGSWLHVLAYPFSAEAKRAPPDPALTSAMRDVLPELIWSAQDKPNQQQRSELVRLLPTLVKRLKQGLDMIGMPDAVARKGMDKLVDVHMRILRAPSAEPDGGYSLNGLRRHCAGLTIAEAGDGTLAGIPSRVELAELENTLARYQLTASLHLECDAIPALAADADWLRQMRIGIAVQVWSKGSAELARLCAISGHRSLYLFVPYQSATPIIFSATCLLKALRDGGVRPVEGAPLFDRAVESLMAGAASVNQEYH